jgi:hypothetical protein
LFAAGQCRRSEENYNTTDKSCSRHVIYVDGNGGSRVRKDKVDVGGIEGVEWRELEDT